MLLYKILACTIHEEMKKNSNNSNWFKILAPTWNGKCDLSDGLYSVSDIQDYFECIFKKYWQTADNLLIRI